MVYQDRELPVKLYSSLIFSVALISLLLFNGDHIYFLSIAWLSLVLWAVYRIGLMNEFVLKLDVVTVIATLFIGWMVASLYWHPVPWQGAYYNWHLGLYFCVLLATYLLLQNKDDLFLVNCVTLVGAFVALLSLYQSFFLGEPAGGFFPNKNNNAAFLNLFMLPQMSLLLLSNQKAKERLFGVVVIFLTFLAIIQISSRGAFIALAAASLLLVGLAMIKRQWKNILLVCCIVLAVLLVDHFFSSTELRKDLQSPSRLHLLSSTIDMIKDGHWYGVGNGMFRILYPTYRHTEELSAGFFVHNDYLQVLLELGVPGLILLLVIITILIGKVYVLLRYADDISGGYLYLGLFAALLSVAIHSMVTFNFYLPAILVVAGLYSGMIFRKVSRNTFDFEYNFSLSITGTGIIITALIMLISTSSIFRVGYADAIEDGFINDDVMKSTPMEHYKIYQDLWDLDPTNHKYPSTMAMTYSLLGEDEDANQRLERFNKSKKLLLIARDLNPYLMKTYVEEALLIINYKDVIGESWNQQAIALTLTALKLNTRAHSLRLRLAKVMVEGGKKEEAMDILLDGLEYTRGMNKGYFEYGKELAEELNRDNDAKRFADHIEKIKQQEKKQLKELIDEYGVKNISP